MVTATGVLQLEKPNHLHVLTDTTGDKTVTNTTEELKREMFEHLEILKQFSKKPKLCEFLENALEAYLEALRQEAIILKSVDINVILHEAYLNQHALLCQVREEADKERNRCQAFEFANKSSGEFLRESQRLLKEARESVKRQRQSIGQLKRDRNDAQHTLKVRDHQLLGARIELQEARKLLGATQVQNNKPMISCAKCGGSGREFVGWHAHDGAAVTIQCLKCAHLRAARQEGVA